MICICLIGGSQSERNRISLIIREEFNRINVYKLPNTSREERMEHMKIVLSGRPSGTFIFNNIRTNEEAELLRDNGAYFAVVYGAPPKIEAKADDLWVALNATAKKGLPDHVESPEEMYSTAFLREMQRRKKVPKARKKYEPKFLY